MDFLEKNFKFIGIAALLAVLFLASLVRQDRKSGLEVIQEKIQRDIPPRANISTVIAWCQQNKFEYRRDRKKRTEHLLYVTSRNTTKSWLIISDTFITFVFDNDNKIKGHEEQEIFTGP